MRDGVFTALRRTQSNSYNENREANVNPIGAACESDQRRLRRRQPEWDKRPLTSKNFSLIGAAGYIAPRHMRAIKETGNELLVVLDPSDSLGIIDSYFPDAHYFSEFERFDREIYRRQRLTDETSIDYVSICSPNYLHDAHCRFALRSGADAICEKPLVLNPWNLDGLAEMEADSGKNIYTILQLRLHPAIIELKRRIEQESRDTKHEVDLTYITARGRWYLQSWKAREDRSGGIATNIGVHFFDMLHYVFGNLQENVVHAHEPTYGSGYLEFEKARVRWFLSIDPEDVPRTDFESGQRTWRSITVDGDEIEFSGGFADLHTQSYEQIIAGKGFPIEANRTAVETVAHIRYAETARNSSLEHPFLAKRR